MLYGAHGRGLDRVRDFLRAGFPRAVRREWRFVWLAIALFFGPLVVLTFAIPRYPDFAYVVLPADVLDSAREMYGADTKTLGRKRDADTDVAMFGFYIFNNVRIGFQTFASGLLFGAGALFYLLFNGMFIGTFFIVGHDACHGSLTPFDSVNRVLGRIAFLPSLAPYITWEFAHNRIHHSYTNWRGKDYAWAPFSKEEYDRMPAWRRSSR